MIVLKIDDSKIDELTRNGVVICSYVALDSGEEFDGVSVEYKDTYPLFEEVEVLVNHE